LAKKSHRDVMAERCREERSAVARVTPDWSTINWRRRNKAGKNSLEFSKTYLKEKFYLPFAELHEKIFTSFDHCLKFGGNQALAAPRKTGKTTLAMAGILRSILYRERQMVIYVCENLELAKDRLNIMKQILATCSELREDFPELLCFNELVGHPQRAHSQHVDNELTGVAWRGTEIVFPKVFYPPEIKAKTKHDCTPQARVTVKGMTAGIRGQLSELGRPDLVVIDDPQGDGDAASGQIKEKSLKLIKRGIAELGGMGDNLSIFMLCTIIEKDDLADQFTDQSREPAWNGLRYAFLENLPKDESDQRKLWDKYILLRKNKTEADRDAREAHRFYLENREAVDGAVVANLPYSYAGKHVVMPGRKKTKNILQDGSEIESSAIQRALNFIADYGEPAFLSEYQNQPLDEYADAGLPDRQAVVQRANGFKRGLAPNWATHVTGFIDVQDEILFYSIMAWGDRFTGHLLDYGAYPNQNVGFFTAKNPRYKLSAATGAVSKEGAWQAGLTELAKMMFDHEWLREDGNALKLQLCMVDANYGASTPTVNAFCRNSGYGASILPSYGRGVTATQKPMSMYHKKEGDLSGAEWRITRSDKYAIRHCLYDTNFWKTFFFNRMIGVPGDKSTISFFGVMDDHNELANHLVSETRKRFDVNSRTVYQYYLRPDQPDNHWLDCMVGCTVAASILGIKITDARVVNRNVHVKPKTKHRSGVPVVRRANKTIRTRY